MNVLLIYPDYTTRWDPDESPYGYYSEGLASISAVLKRAGHNVYLLHLKKSHNKEYFVEEIRKMSPDIAAFTCRTTLFKDVCQYANWIKEDFGEIYTLIGGYHPTLAPKDVASSKGNPFDFICIGEGEFTLLELVDMLENNSNPEGIRNLWVKRNGDYKINPVRPLISNLDELPLPDIDLFDYANLYSPRLNTAPVIINRGCPFTCTYCCNHQFRKVYPNSNHYVRIRSPEGSIKYIENIINKYPNIKIINFMDNILPVNKDWFFEFIEMYKERINLPFIARYHAALHNKEVVKALKEAGCYQVHFGIESGNDQIRYKILKRPIPKEKMIEALNDCHRAGITTLTYNMVGLPYEDKKKFLETVKLNAILDAGRCILSIFFPYPNTTLYEITKAGGFLTSKPDYIHEKYLDQPQFPHQHVLFCHRTFPFMVRLYRLINRLPNVISKHLENTIDRIYTNTHLPHNTLIAISDGINWLYSWSKRLLANLSPNIYQWLRRRMVFSR